MTQRYPLAQRKNGAKIIRKISVHCWIGESVSARGKERSGVLITRYRR